MSVEPSPQVEPELIIPADHPASPASQPPTRLERFRKLSLWLFLATVLSTFFAGALFQPGEFTLVGCLSRGAAYSATIMAILMAHEMGHYLQALRYGVPATPPLFIPMPISPVGTMGAVIVQGAGYADRKILFDVAVSGPLAGLVVAIPALAWGAQYLTPTTEPQPGAMVFADPLLVKMIIQVVQGSYLGETNYNFSGISGAVFFAGWFGVLVTGLNLIPLGQLDGGHILYCLVGTRQHQIARVLYYSAVFYVLIDWMFFTGGTMNWMLMLILVTLMGIRHPPTKHDHVPLDPVRQAIGWFALGLLILCFIPNPIYEIPAKP